MLKAQDTARPGPPRLVRAGRHSALHLHLAGQGRWRTVMDARQQTHRARRFGPWLEAMGYASG